MCCMYFWLFLLGKYPNSPNISYEFSFFLSYEINLLSRLVKNKDHKQRFHVRYHWWSINNVMWSPVHESAVKHERLYVYPILFPLATATNVKQKVFPSAVETRQKTNW